MKINRTYLWILKPTTQCTILIKIEIVFRRMNKIITAIVKRKNGHDTLSRSTIHHSDREL